MDTKQKRGRPSNAELSARAKEAEAEVARLKAELEAKAEAGEEIKRDATVLYDPYETKRAFRVMKDLPATQEFPEGQTLGWRSPVYRERRGWRGWTPLQYGDEYAGKEGEKLAEYIDDPPRRMPMQTDSYVRRGDLILCRIDSRIFKRRQAKRAEDAAKRAGLAEEQAQAAGLFGAGVEQDSRPRAVGGGKVSGPNTYKGHTQAMPEHEQ